MLNLCLYHPPELSVVAFKAAQDLEVEFRKIVLNKDYPKIKCNINRKGLKGLSSNKIFILLELKFYISIMQHAYAFQTKEQ